MLHIGAGRYDRDDVGHATFGIWRRLAEGFEDYAVVGRHIRPHDARINEGDLHVHLLASRVAREAEFVATQFRAMPIARAARSDVVVAQCPALGGLAGAALRRAGRCGLLVELHGMHYFEDATPGSPDWVIQALARIGLSRADRIRVLTERMGHLLTTRYGAALADRIVCVPPRVDLRLFGTPKSDWTLGRPPVIAMVGAINENKGQVRLLRTLKRAGINAEVWIVGDGPGRMAAEAEAAAGGGGSLRTSFLGRLRHDALARLLVRADVLVVFSRAEATPRVILEAMACALPVVATDVGFCRDVSEGIMLGIDPEAELPGVLDRLFADRTLREGLGRAGRARVARDFEADMVFARYRSLIAEAAGAAR